MGKIIDLCNSLQESLEAFHPNHAPDNNEEYRDLMLKLSDLKDAVSEVASTKSDMAINYASNADKNNVDIPTGEVLVKEVASAGDVGAIADSLIGNAIDVVAKADLDVQDNKENWLNAPDENYEKYVGEIKDAVGEAIDAAKDFADYKDSDGWGNIVHETESKIESSVSDKGLDSDVMSLRLNDDGILVDKFGMSLNGELVEKLPDFQEKADEYKADFEKYCNELNKLRDYDSEEKLVPEDIDGIFDRIDKFNNPVEYAEYGDERGLQKSVDADNKEHTDKYTSLSREAYSIEKPSEEKIEALKEDMLGISRENDNVDNGGYQDAENEAPSRGDTDNSDEQDERQLPEDSAMASENGRAAKWQLTDDPKLNSLIEIRNSYVGNSPIFGTYRSNPVYQFVNMRAVLYARANGIPIKDARGNSEVPSTLACLQAIRAFTNVNIPEFLILSLVSGIIDAFSKDPTDLGIEAKDNDNRDPVDNNRDNTDNENKNDTDNENKNDTDNENKNDTDNENKNDTDNENKNDTDNENKNDTDNENKNDTDNENKNDTDNENKNDTDNENKNDTDNENKDDTDNENKNDTDNENKNDTDNENKNDTDNENKNDTDNENKNDTDNENKNDTDNENKNDTDNENKNDTDNENNNDTDNENKNDTDNENNNDTDNENNNDTDNENNNDVDDENNNDIDDENNNDTDNENNNDTDNENNNDTDNENNNDVDDENKNDTDNENNNDIDNENNNDVDDENNNDTDNENNNDVDDENNNDTDNENNNDVDDENKNDTDNENNNDTDNENNNDVESGNEENADNLENAQEATDVTTGTADADTDNISNDNTNDTGENTLENENVEQQQLENQAAPPENEDGDDVEETPQDDKDEAANDVVAAAGASAAAVGAGATVDNDVDEEIRRNSGGGGGGGNVSSENNSPMQEMENSEFTSAETDTTISETENAANAGVGTPATADTGFPEAAVTAAAETKDTESFGLTDAIQDYIVNPAVDWNDFLGETISVNGQETTVGEALTGENPEASISVEDFGNSIGSIIANLGFDTPNFGLMTDGLSDLIQNASSTFGMENISSAVTSALDGMDTGTQSIASDVFDSVVQTALENSGVTLDTSPPEDFSGTEFSQDMNDIMNGVLENTNIPEAVDAAARFSDMENNGFNFDQVDSDLFANAFPEDFGALESALPDVLEQNTVQGVEGFDASESLRQMDAMADMTATGADSIVGAESALQDAVNAMNAVDPLSEQNQQRVDTPSTDTNPVDTSSDTPSNDDYDSQDVDSGIE